MQNAPSEKLIKRLQALLALADVSRNSSEREAALAMAKAQELLAEHNLTMASVFSTDASADVEKREKTEVGGLRHGNGRGAMYKYQHELMYAIASANFCKHFIHTTGQTWNGRRHTAGVKSHVLLGRESNVIACRLMFEYLNETMERLVPIASNAERLSKSAISWKEGCAHRLIERIEDRAQELERANRKQAEEAAARASEAAARSKHPAAAPSGETFHAPVVLLTDYAQLERDLNQDVYMGWAPGTTAENRREYAAELEARRNAPASVEPEEETPPAKPETEAQRRKRMEKEARANRRYWERRERQEQREYLKRDQRAYRAGQSAGDNIGLDTQVKGDGTRRIK